MTRINRMVMHGFKSFAHNTELVFGDEFNVILGPNGSGKSNVLDSLCFVLGRLSSKSLRAEKSANLIYNGGKTKKPMKQGEVSIYFDNSSKIFPTEEKEVKITRIIKADGQSIYKINDKKRTRQQILELMAVARIDPEGFNIILQGDIVKFTEMHPEQRRSLIEEISGIAVYEEKKQKTLRELEKVEEKLKEAEIVLAERKKHLNELKKDRDQALKFRELESKVKENKASYLYIQIQRKEKEKNKLESRIKEQQEKIDKFQENISKLKKEIGEKRKQIADINKELEEKSEQERVSVHQEIEQLKVNLATDKTKLENFRNEIEKISLREQQLKKELKDYDKQIEELNEQKKELEKSKQNKKQEQSEIDNKIEKFKKKHQLDNLEDIEKQIDESDKKIEENTQKAHELREQQQDLLRKKDQVEFQINTIDEQIKKVLQIEKEHQEQIEELKQKKQEFKETITSLNKRLNDDSLYARQLGDLRNKSSAAHEELAKLNAKNMQIKERLGENLAVTKILAQKNNIKGIHGTVSELGSVSSEYALALEIAAGPRMNSVIVESDKVASDCIKYLKKNKLGIVTFIPLNKIKEKTISQEAKKLTKNSGAHDFAINLISFDNKFKKAFSYIFGNTLVVENIDTARKIGIGKARMVTIDGDLAEISGAMQGGYRRRKQRGGFQQKEIVKKIKDQGEIIENFKQEIDNLEKIRVKNEDKITSLRQKRATLEGEIIKTEKALHLDTTDLEASKESKQELRKEAKQFDKKLEELQNIISETNKKIADAKTKKQQLRTKINELRSPTLIAELNTFGEKKTQLKDELLKIESDIHTINIRFNDMILPEKEKINDILKQQAKEAEKFSSEIKLLSEKIKSDGVLLKEKEKASQEFYKKYKSLFTKRDKIGDEIQKQEAKIEEAREQSKGIEIKMNEVNLKKAEVFGKLAGLQQEFEQFEGVKIDTSKSEEELKEAINKFEKMVNDIGSVNMRALEIYEEVEKEYDVLLGKKEKLIQEKEEVFKMMEEIEGKKKELFMKTFDVVNNNFKRIFSELSKKGDASLVLENPENPFEAGLNIKVRITGTKFLDIRSLSGGEKTMTALAFIFAIQEHEPHSFYVLDEVDAALDKHNSEKLAGLIRKYADKAQYVMISHNDAIISEADNLYGVSMDEHGISKVVSLKL